MSKDNQTRKQDNSIFSKVNTRLILMLAGLVTVIIIVVVVFTVPKAAYAKKVREQLDLGEKYLSELDYESAVVAYRTAIIIDPKAEDAYLGLADAYLEMGEPGKAVEILESAEKELTSEAITDKQKAAKRAKKEAGTRAGADEYSNTDKCADTYRDSGADRETNSDGRTPSNQYSNSDTDGYTGGNTGTDDRAGTNRYSGSSDNTGA